MLIRKFYLYLGLQDVVNICLLIIFLTDIEYRINTAQSGYSKIMISSKSTNNIHTVIKTNQQQN